LKAGSKLEYAFSQDNPVVTAEIMPPRTPSDAVLKKRTKSMLGSITAANLTDNQSATVRMASMAACKIVMDNGIEPIMQITCRDRNRLAIQADILGASALGIKNILCVSGDHQIFGNHAGSKNVYDLDAIHLINLLKNMRDEGKFINDEPIRNRSKSKIVPPPLLIGAAANPFGNPSPYRPYHLLKKMKAGADFVQTQPVFDFATFEKWVSKVNELGIPEKTSILAGITPVKSVRALAYMKARVPGMFIPSKIIERMKNSRDPEQEGYEIAKETVQQVMALPGIKGVHFMAIGWESIVPILVSDLNLKNQLPGEQGK